MSSVTLRKLLRMESGRFAEVLSILIEKEIFQ